MYMKKNLKRVAQDIQRARLYPRYDFECKDAKISANTDSVAIGAAIRANCCIFVVGVISRPINT